ncbi:hypothetical protein BV22DRAFT_1111048 [Leucogyrophana mollusca]|uniref:Uncharacterized protein n=1 Tax=Leucogyrophana mollusca TaxID=85980 RepID=A0ACB8BNK7_9AGAM|nr:hypothetical protein BV22DRAFT_1111048 [Leucogyrophana mollusca]
MSNSPLTATADPTLKAAATTATVDVARALQASLEAAKLRILDAHVQLKEYRFEGLDEDADGNGEGDGSLRDPAVVRSDVAAQVSFLRRLKFQYLEQNAKDKYIKTIVADDAPLVTSAGNEELRVRNEEKKSALKAAKGRLEEKRGDVKVLAPLVEEDYNRAKALTEEASSLSQKILDARLQLTRLRQTYPHPRLTVKSASQQLEEQVAEMQAVDEALQDVNERIARVKENVKAGVGEVERLRAARAEVEKMKVAEGEVEEDGRIGGLYDWFSASLTLHRSLLSLVSSHSETDNELRLKYAVNGREVTIKLLFIPNTRQLAAAEVRMDGADVDLGDVVDTHVHSNDISGLVWAVLARTRHSFTADSNSMED